MQKEIEARKVVNLTDNPLTESEIDLLKKGLNFCPTPQIIQKDKIYNDIDIFKRNLSLKVHFYKPEGTELSKENGNSEYTTLQKLLRRENKQPFQPPTVHCIEALSSALKDEIETCQKTKLKDNISIRERNALKRLADNPNIIIKQADKGGATVVMKSSSYKSEALRQLNDTTFYCKGNSDKTMEHEKLIENTLNRLKNLGELSVKLAENLTPRNSRTAEFYLLPKIHKEGNPGRPVISSSGCHTEKISAFVDEHLKPIAQGLPSYIKDSFDFVRKIRSINKIPQNSYLVTLDVKSLYTNIDNTDGLEAMKEKLEERQNSSTKANTICLLMKLILTLNNFIFNGENYQQIKGTAMGTRAAPNYANIFMGKFEKTHIYESNWWEYLRFFCRFIDDLFFIWTGTESNLIEFINHLNSVNQDIKFTYKYSTRNMDFLDVTVMKDDEGNLTTDVFQKETDTHSYLQQSSSHPNNCKKGIPYSQFLRLRRLCTDNNTLKRRLSEYIEYFVNVGYSRKVLKDTATKLLARSQMETLVENNIQKEARTRLITTYNALLPPIDSIVRKHWPITQVTDKCRKALTKPPQIVYKRNQNLKDILVKSKYRETEENQDNQEQGVSKCKNRRCSWCKNIKEGKKFTSNSTKKEYNIRHKLTCNSPWVIYLAECRNHPKQYTGKSQWPLNIRFNNTRNHLRIGQVNCTLVEHFLNSNDCNFEDHLILMPIEQIKIAKDPNKSMEEKKKILAQREIFWQNKLQTFIPHGLNKREG